MENRKKKILVVDDDVQFVDMVKTLLESVGYDVAFAYQARKGMDLAKKEPPDLILLDVMFAGPPGPDGFEASRELHDDPRLKKVPIIIVSGFRKVLDLPFKYQPDDEWMPVQGFIEKPVKPDELLGAIKKIFGEGEAKKR
jgi:two-component system, OmpR family, alkaline phosphatase synthesis response regulator PhoP